MNVGIIGLGYMGLQHLKVMRKLHADGVVSANILHVCDRDRKQLEKVAGKYGVRRASSSPEVLIGDEDLDAVIVATPWATHRDLACGALGAGRAVFCEKPLGATLGEVKDMASAARGVDLPNQGGLVLRASPSLWKIRQLVQNEDWGPLRMATLREDACFPEGGIYRTPWQERLSGRGILWEENVHDLDTLLYLLGPLEAVSASMDHHAEAPGIDVATRAELRTADGAPVFFSSLWHAVQRRGSRRHLELFFDRGLVVTDYFTTGDFLVQSGSGEASVVSAEEALEEYTTRHGYPDRLRDRRQYPWYATFATLGFLRAVERGDPCQPDFADCLAVHELVEAIYGMARWNRLDGDCGIPRRPAGP